MTDTTTTPTTTPASAFPQSLTSSHNSHIHVSLTYSPPSLTTAVDHVRSPAAGGIVTFTGTTRSTFGAPGSERPVSTLSYSAYAPLALRTMLAIAEEVCAKHDLMGVYMVHRLGECPVGEDSIVIAVSGKHRGECWRAGEEALELCKERVEVWKMERFKDGDGEGVWRANRDGKAGVRVDSDANGTGD